MHPPARFVEARGSGTLLSLGLISAIVGLTLILITVTGQSVSQARLNALADNAAIAAADALRGLVAGYPCEVAKQLASDANCRVDGNDVLVEITRGALRARARAGEPG